MPAVKRTSARARTSSRRPARVYTQRLIPVLRMIDIDMVARATLNGAGVDARLVNAISDMEVEMSLQGASQLTVTIEDPSRDILRSELLAGRIDLALPGGGRWRMNLPRDVGGISIQGPTTSLRFWDLGAAALQEHFDPLRKSARSLDLAGFVRLLAREVASEVSLRVVVPDPGEVPHLEEETRRDRVGRGTPAATSGWSPRAAAHVRINGARASTEQLRVMDAVFTEAVKYDPPGLAMLALAAAITVECEYFNQQGAGADAVSFGVIQNIPGTSVGVNGTMTRAQAMDIAYSVKSALLPPGPTSQGGLILLAKQNPGWSPGRVAAIAINGGGDPLYVTKVDSFSPEAKRNIELWTGRTFGNFRRGGSDGRTDAVVYKPAEWRRGVPNRREGSWKTLKRYADQLGRRRFIAAPLARQPRLVMAQDQQLILATPHMSFPLDDDEIITDDPMIDLEGRARLETIELSVLASAWSAPPGAVVDLTRAGPADGPWLVDTIRLRSGDPVPDVTLSQPTTRREPDPAVSRARRRGLLVGGVNVGSGARAAIAWARAQVGTTESPLGSNAGPKIDDWQAEFGLHGVQWCGIFVGVALRAAGVRGIDSRIASTEAIVELGRTASGGMLQLLPARLAQPGDVWVVNPGPNGHTALITQVLGATIVTIGGNESQGVRETTRSVLGAGNYFVRPQYP